METREVEAGMEALKKEMAEREAKHEKKIKNLEKRLWEQKVAFEKGAAELGMQAGSF